MEPVKYYYLYEIKNKETGIIYIGVHETYCLNDGYLGSGKIISRAIKKYGKLAFEKTIIEFFDTREAMYEREAEIVNEEFIARSDNMNIALGGTGGSMINNQKPFTETHSIETRRKLSECNRNKTVPETVRRKISENNFSKRYPEQQRAHAIEAGKLRWKHNNTGLHKHKEETKLKISKSLTGKTHTQESKLLMSAKQTLRRARDPSMRWIYSNSEQKSKMILSTDPLLLGWHEGRKFKFN